MEKLKRWKTELLVQNKVEKIKGERETAGSPKDQKKKSQEMKGNWKQDIE